MSLTAVSRRPLFALVAVCATALAVAVLLGGVQSSSAEQGQYLHFGGPGSGYIEVAHSPALNPPAEITIEAWIRLASTGAWGIGPTGCPTIAGKNYKTSYWFGIQCNSDKLLFYAHGLGTSAQSTGSVPVNEWVHVAVTYDSVDVKFFVNGILDSTVPIAGPLDTNTDAFRIGNDVEWDQSPIGDIDEVHFWNIVRSQQAIMLDMDTITGPQPGLVGVWNMEGTPNSDIGGFTGTLHGDAAFDGTPIATPEPAFLKGDTDCDHQLAASDAMAILNDLASLDPPLENCANPLLLTSQGVPDLWWDASPGEGYIEVPHSEALNPVDAITVEIWVNVWSYMSPDGADRCNSLAGKGYTTAWWLGLCSGKLRFYGRDAEFVDSTGSVPLREWVHVAAVADHTSIKFYINGDLDSEFTNDDAELGTNTDPMRIGSDPDYNRRPWAALDDVRIWNIALTEEQVEGVMSNPPVFPSDGLVANYTLDGNAEDIANDHEGGAVDTVTYSTHLPTPYWPDIDCDGLLGADDIVPILASLASVGEEFEGPDGCEPLETPTG
jgi:hypothetical protein